MEKGLAKCLLKIFSGPHLGAEVLLANGSYTLGRDDACDIILNDQTVAPRHLRLSIDEGRIRLSALEARFSLDGKVWADAEAGLGFFQMVGIGTTNFSIGPLGERWPEVILPDRSYAGSEKVEPVLEEGEEKDSGKEGEMRGFAFHQALLGKKGRWWIGAGCGVLVVAMFLFFLSYGTESNEKNGTKDNRDNLSLLREELKNLNLPNVQMISGNTGDILVKGYVPTAAEKRQLLDILQRVLPTASFYVWTLEDLVQACQDGLEAYGLNLLVEPGESGNITLRGYVGNEALLRKAVATLRQDIPAINRIDNQALTPETILPAISGLLEQFGLTGRIRVEPYPSYLLAKGSLTYADGEQWEKAKDAILTKFRRQVVLKEDIVVRKESPRGETQQARAFTFTLPIKGVTIGTVRYITTVDGGKYFEGGTMEDGLIVKNIFSNRIVLTQGGQEFVYYLGGEK